MCLRNTLTYLLTYLHVVVVVVSMLCSMSHKYHHALQMLKHTYWYWYIVDIRKNSSLSFVWRFLLSIQL